MQFWCTLKKKVEERLPKPKNHEYHLFKMARLSAGTEENIQLKRLPAALRYSARVRDGFYLKGHRPTYYSFNENSCENLLNRATEKNLVKSNSTNPAVAGVSQPYDAAIQQLRSIPNRGNSHSRE